MKIYIRKHDDRDKSIGYEIDFYFTEITDDPPIKDYCFFDIGFDARSVKEDHIMNYIANILSYYELSFYNIKFHTKSKNDSYSLPLDDSRKLKMDSGLESMFLINSCSDDHTRRKLSHQTAIDIANYWMDMDFHKYLNINIDTKIETFLNKAHDKFVIQSRTSQDIADCFRF